MIRNPDFQCQRQEMQIEKDLTENMVLFSLGCKCQYKLIHCSGQAYVFLSSSHRKGRKPDHCGW